jgi:serine/threonine protein kinase
MEFLEGVTLGEEMRRVGPMPAERCAEILVPVCAVLAEAHARGLVHRDIKPSNIFLQQGRSGEVVKVIDFGIAKLLDNAAVPAPRAGTASGVLVGTPAYIAPERFEGGTYDGAVDVYAVGVTLYEMLSGELPFETAANEWVQAMMRVVDAPRPLRPFRVRVPASLDAAVRRSLARNPRERPSAEEMGGILARLRAPDGACTVSPAPPSSVRTATVAS